MGEEFAVVLGNVDARVPLCSCNARNLGSCCDAREFEPRQPLDRRGMLEAPGAVFRIRLKRICGNLPYTNSLASRRHGNPSFKQ